MKQTQLGIKVLWKNYDTPITAMRSNEKQLYSQNYTLL